MASGRLRLDHAEGVLDLGPAVCLCSLDQILESSLLCIRQNPAFAWSHRHLDYRFRACHLGPFGDALISGIAVHHVLVAMQLLGSWGEVVDIGGRGDERMDQA